MTRILLLSRAGPVRSESPCGKSTLVLFRSDLTKTTEPGGPVSSISTPSSYLLSISTQCRRRPRYGQVYQEPLGSTRYPHRRRRPNWSINRGVHLAEDLLGLLNYGPQSSCPALPLPTNHQHSARSRSGMLRMAAYISYGNNGASQHLA